jgi:uncharacterized membrane protein
VGNSRLEAFSDGVLAIILDLRVPGGIDLSALKPVLPVFLSYALSFLYLGIYWNNHHHLLHTVQRVTGPIMWANLHLLFWLSLFPFVTAWTGENRFPPGPTFLYGFVLLMAAIAYYLLEAAIIAEHGPSSVLKRAVGADWKGKLSPILYFFAMLRAYASPGLANAVYIVVALLWLVPDKRIERALKERA